MINEFGTDHVYNCDVFNEMQPLQGDPEYIGSIGRAVFNAMTIVDPQAVWYTRLNGRSSVDRRSNASLTTQGYAGLAVQKRRRLLDPRTFESIAHVSSSGKRISPLYSNP